MGYNITFLKLYRAHDSHDMFLETKALLDHPADKLHLPALGDHLQLRRRAHRLRLGSRHAAGSHDALRLQGVAEEWRVAHGEVIRLLSIGGALHYMLKHIALLSFNNCRERNVSRNYVIMTRCHLKLFLPSKCSLILYCVIK